MTCQRPRDESPGVIPGGGLDRRRWPRARFTGRGVQSDQHVPSLCESALRRLAGATERDVGVERPGHAPPQAAEPLSESEVRVLRLLSGDLTYREIGRHLYLSANTVRTHAQRIRRKLGVSTRAGAVTRARQLGLI